MCLGESCFSDCWKVSSVVPIFKNVGGKVYDQKLFFFPCLLKFFEKLVNDSLVDHLQKSGLFSEFQYGFKSSRSIADLLTVVSDRIASAFYRYVARDTCNTFDRVWYPGLLHKLKSYGISGWVFGLISSFLSNR